MVDLRRHPNDVVRHGVAFPLAFLPSLDALDALLELMEDPYEMVRDWATTGVGMHPEIDSHEMRDALLKRACDEDEIIRAEDLHGLARRGDERAVAYLIAELTQPSERYYLFEDAAKTFLGLDIDAPVETGILVQSLAASRPAS